MTQQIRSLLPPGGFSNLVGHYVSALDIGLTYAAEAARGAGDAGAACRALRAYGELESTWVHEAVGQVPTPPAPEQDDDVEAWLGWLDAVRTVTIMVLRPLQDRDLERLIRVAGEEGAARTLKRVLAELLFLQGRALGGI
ncbi:MAG: hypothetical protein QNJ90_15915 [Planctomycetota bacterium]|nr:hypothetical protein [Planctomycetota bacterium]